MRMCPINTLPLRKAVACVWQLAAQGELCSGREMPRLAEAGLPPGAEGSCKGSWITSARNSQF